MAKRSTHCSGYYQHWCGVELTDANRSPKRAGKCHACARRYPAAEYYHREGLDVPQRVHDGDILRRGRRKRDTGPILADRDNNGRATLQETQDAAAKRQTDALQPWRDGPFRMEDIPGAVLLRFGDGRELTNHILAELAEVIELRDVALYQCTRWLMAACRRKGFDPESDRPPRVRDANREGSHVRASNDKRTKRRQ